MIYNTYEMKEKGSLPGAKLSVYLQEVSPELKLEKRPLILICPGGGYGMTSDREADPLAFAFLGMGYHAAVLRYSCAPAVFPTALSELAASMAMIRRKAEEWYVDEEKILVLGCSAGGHLAASLGMFWDEDFVAEGIGLSASSHELLKPSGMILCYPVITSGEFAHRDSFKNLLGDREEALSGKMSLEKQVSSKTPPAFIWHTYTDSCVPVENSLLLVNALQRKGIPTEFHMYGRGGHGLSLANHLTETPDGGGMQEECSSWIGLVHTWIESLGKE